jgi:hypothetical protein
MACMQARIRVTGGAGVTSPQPLDVMAITLKNYVVPRLSCHFLKSIPSVKSKRPEKQKPV